ncbi:MAG: hypothetical protein RMY64_03030 [Nostoc sp. DedQUE08]|uniref:hypothetical protein n=1 Tax=Nostoc sp. DedQUE08 TaxID=3075393 RepID=UPI002AD4652C|nr:hypothetical protein [Nostoc sp. DedQUE08]MDZ8064602.1 hypothetical protein [Nostoc sp. DedQUE08]
MADYSFPFGQALELLLACFKGTISARINSLQQKLQKTDIFSQPDNQQQVQKLNKLESQAWLYEGVLERFGEDPTANPEKIARTLEALEYKRSEILQELEPRKPKRYQIFAGIQNVVRSLLASQAEKDYERLDKIVTNLVLFARSKQPSEFILSEVIERIAVEIAQNANQISPYRLRLAYKIDDLIKVLSAKLVLGSDRSRTDSSYQALINELRSRISLLSDQFNSLLRSRQENTNNLNKRIQEISNLTKNISALHKAISERDADIAVLRKNTQDLTESAQKKQAQIDSLQNSISNLQRDIQNSKDIDRQKQAQVSYLENQLSQLNQQKSDLQKRIQDISDYARSKESNVKNLQREKSQLNSQNSELQIQCQTLSNEITSLKEQIKNLSQTNRAQSTSPAYKTPQPSVKRVATKKTVSIKEYENISNQSDYIYIDTYYREDGTPVRAHYRRKPNR